MSDTNTPLNLPPDDSEFSFADAPARPVPPLSLSPREQTCADDHTPPGLSNPFWSK